MARQTKAKRVEAEAEATVDINGYDYKYASDIVEEEKDWLWRGHLLRGALEITAGASGIAKSQAQISFIRCVTTGCDWPDGQKGLGTPAYVIMLTGEDSQKQELKPRLMAAGADCSKVVILDFIRKDKKNRMFMLGEDLDKLEHLIKRLRAEGKEVALITMDPITAYMGGKMDNYRATEVRAQLGPLVAMIEQQHVALSAITHPPKSAGPNAADHFNGSGAFVHVPRIAHLCIKEYDDNYEETGRALFAQVINNADAMQTTLAYHTATKHIIGRDKDRDVHPFVVWEEAVEVTANQAIGRAKQHYKNESGVKDFIREFLEDQLRDGPMLQTEIMKAAEKIRIKNHAVWRAAKRMKIIFKKDEEVNGKWRWTHPKYPEQQTMKFKVVRPGVNAVMP
jgi:hypothetical protein